jgi:hypothetical protein
MIQPFGTTKIAVTFAPIVIIWLGFNAGFGIYNLVLFDHSVLKAFSPSFAFKFLIRNKTGGWKMLGGVLLAFTGVEALFADLGAFSRRAIQLSWLCYAFPCLLLGYVGQAAYISVCSFLIPSSNGFRYMGHSHPAQGCCMLGIYEDSSIRFTFRQQTVDSGDGRTFLKSLNFRLYFGQFLLTLSRSTQGLTRILFSTPPPQECSIQV